MSYSTSCRVEYDLSAYEDYQDHLEQEHLMTISDKRCEAIELAREILEGDTTEEYFYRAFEQFYDGDTDEYDSELLVVIESWWQGELEEGDEDLIHYYAKLALECAVEVLWNEDVDYILEDGYSINKLIEEILG